MVGWSFVQPDHIRRNIAAKRAIAEKQAVEKRRKVRPAEPLKGKALLHSVYRKMVADGRLPQPDLAEVMRDA